MLPNSLERKFLLHKCIFEKNSSLNKFLDLKRDSKKFKRSWLSECDKKFSLSLHMKTFREEERKKKVCVWVSEWVSEREHLCVREWESDCACVCEKKLLNISLPFPFQPQNTTFISIWIQIKCWERRREGTFSYSIFSLSLILTTFFNKTFSIFVAWNEHSKKEFLCNFVF